jgi:hypothetical protein
MSCLFTTGSARLAYRLRVDAAPSIASLVLIFGSRRLRSDRDRTTTPPSPNPRAQTRHQVAFDEGHRDRHGTAERTILAQLLKTIATTSLGSTIDHREAALFLQVLVIACARVADEMHPHSPAECAAIERWVGAGGGLLLVTDTLTGSAAESLGKAFGVR